MIAPGGAPCEAGTGVSETFRGLFGPFGTFWYLFGPAPGFRDSGYGELGVLHNVGHDGYSWSSSSVNSGDYYRDLDLSFNTQGLNPNSVHYRAYGLQLRCLSE